MTGLSVVKRLSKSRSDKPCGCSDSGRSSEEVHDVDEADLQVREELAKVDGGGERLLGGDVACAGHYDVRLVPPSLEASAQMLTPFVQWLTAWSIVMYWRWFCLSQTMTLM